MKIILVLKRKYDDGGTQMGLSSRTYRYIFVQQEILVIIYLFFFFVKQISSYKNICVAVLRIKDVSVSCMSSKLIQDIVSYVLHDYQKLLFHISLFLNLKNLCSTFKTYFIYFLNCYIYLIFKVLHIWTGSGNCVMIHQFSHLRRVKATFSFVIFRDNILNLNTVLSD